MRRIGPEAAKMRRARARLRIWAWCLVPVGAAITVAGIAFAAARGMTQSAQSVLAVALTLGFFVLSAALFCALKARQQLFAMRGAAMSFANARDPHVADSEPTGRLSGGATLDVGVRERGDRPHPAVLVTEGWTPDGIRPILPGRTAREWFRLAAIFGIGFGATITIGAAPLAVAAFHHVWIGVVIVISIAGFFLVAASVIAILGGRKLGAEYAHGYSTNMPDGGYRGVNDFRTDVDLVDAKTGRLLRRAGDPPLDQHDYFGRIREIRSSHPDATPEYLTRDGRRSR
ncbi:hypothetical protein [Microbacterium sp. 22242]|uniref:hypothetical protein n=1 Tax=Microbacterium sp. 22242 TaxID=3453896 RepID=UPI003F84765A